MQNVSNLNCPFFGKDGKPISAGRVHFVKPDTSASDFNGIAEFDYITIKNKNGATLQNPLPLDELGQFSIQPFVEDGVNFKMVVDKPTGIPSEYDNDIASWETQLVIDSKSFIPQMQYAGLTSVGSIAELRTVNPSLGKVEVTGYYEAGDCPSRVFVYKNESLTENYGTRIKSSFAGANGYWVMVASDTIDVRWFGIKTSYSEKTDIAQRLNLIANEGITVLFPRGNYYISYDISLSSCIFEDGAKIFPFGNNNVKLTIGSFTNNGGKFCAVSNATNAARVIPCLTGVIKTSWLQGTLNDFITTDFLDNVTNVVVDEFTTSSTNKTFSKKVIHLINGVIPENLIISSENIIVNYKENTVKSSGFDTGFLRLNSLSLSLSDDNLFEIWQKEDEQIFIRFNKDIEVIGSGYFGNGLKVDSNPVNCINGFYIDSNNYVAGNSLKLSGSGTFGGTGSFGKLLQAKGGLNVTGDTKTGGLFQNCLEIRGDYDLTQNYVNVEKGCRLLIISIGGTYKVKLWEAGFAEQQTITIPISKVLELYSLGVNEITTPTGKTNCTQWAVFM